MSWRMYPARSNRRWLTASASLGSSRNVGMNAWDHRIPGTVVTVPAKGGLIMEKLDGKVAVITGGGNGIGRALAHVLAGEGCRLMLADIDSDALEAAADSVRSTGADVATMVTDVTDAKAVDGLAAATVERY